MVNHYGNNVYSVKLKIPLIITAIVQINQTYVLQHADLTLTKIK